MSYAGPVSRGKRVSSTESAKEGSSQADLGQRRQLTASSAGSASAGQGTIFAAGLALGIALGAGAALLLAPNSGAETRRALVRRSRKVGRRSRDAWDDLRDELRNALRDRRRARRRKRLAAQEAEADV